MSDIPELKLPDSVSALFGDQGENAILRAAPEVKPITLQEAISIVENTEVAEMTEEGDRRWTRRMAAALMQAANARILSALYQDTKETK